MRLGYCRAYIVNAVVSVVSRAESLFLSITGIFFNTMRFAIRGSRRRVRSALTEHFQNLAARDAIYLAAVELSRELDQNTRLAAILMASLLGILNDMNNLEFMVANRALIDEARARLIRRMNAAPDSETIGRFYVDKKASRADFDREIYEEPVCVVCISAPSRVIFMDCLHKALCASCAERVESCPMCRGASRRVFLE